jgi:gas vesicle protein
MFDTSSNEGSYGSSLMVFLLGVAVGATAAILYAPMSGTETRKQIADKAGHLKDKAAEMKDTVVERAGELKEAATSRLHGAADTAHEAVAGAVDGAADKVRKDDKARS